MNTIEKAVIDAAKAKNENSALPDPLTTVGSLRRAQETIAVTKVFDHCVKGMEENRVSPDVAALSCAQVISAPKR